MENTCGDPGDALKNVSTSGLVRTLKTADDSSSLSLTLQYPSFLHPPFFLYSNIIWKISLLPKVRPEKKVLIWILPQQQW